MGAFLVVDIEVAKPEAYGDYIKQVPPLVAKHGGVYRIRGGHHTVMEGDWNPKRLVLIEFPDRKSAEAFYTDTAYADLKALRQATTTSKLLIIDGL